MEREIYEQYQSQSALQAESQQGEQIQNAPMMQEYVQQQTAVMIESLDPNRIVEGIINRFQGIRKNPDGSQEIVSAPVLNNVGVGEVWLWLDGFVNRNMTMGVIKEEQARLMVMEMSKDWTRVVGYNWKRWGMQKNQKDYVDRVVIYNMAMCLNRSIEGNEKRILGRITFENIMPNRGGFSPKKEGFFAKHFGLGGNKQ